MKQPIRIAAVGDIMLGEYAALGFGVRSRSVQLGADWPLALVRERLNDFDLVVGNLEAPLSDRGRNAWRYSSVVFRGLAEAAKALREANFRALSLANNHMLQHGREVFSDTVRHLEDAGVVAVGLRNRSGGSRLATLEMRGVRLGFLGYSLWPSEAHEHENDCFPMVVGREETIIDDVRSHVKSVDHLLVCIHWGYEFVHVPSEREITLGRAIVDAGARAVLAHHPHVLQGVERYKKGLIAYSLGNFVFDMDDPACRESAILELTLTDSTLEYRWEPVWLDDTFRPAIATGEDERRILAHLAKYNTMITDESSAGDRTVEACRAASARGKVAAQRRQNRYFLKNAHRYPVRFVFVKLARKLLNLAQGRYRTAQYHRDISHA
ncbi:CapA family protein [bacterium]|nr:CapA family protein [bacterium]